MTKHTPGMSIPARAKTARPISQPWGILASELITKPVFIEGRLQLDSWDDKQTGQKRSRLRVVAESIQLLGSRQEGESSSPTPSPALAEQRARQTAPAPQGRTSQPDPDLDAEPDDIPF